jgi:hypothetical protein
LRERAPRAVCIRNHADDPNAVGPGGGAAP